MPPQRVIERGGERDEQHVADLAAGIRHHPGEDDHRRDPLRRRLQHHQPEHRTHEPGVFGDADPEQTGERDAERRIGEEVARRLQDHPLHAFDREEIDRRDDLAVGGIGHGDAQTVAEPRYEHDQPGEGDEERRGMREGVTGAFDVAKETVDQRGARRSAHDLSVS